MFKYDSILLGNNMETQDSYKLKQWLDHRHDDVMFEFVHCGDLQGSLIEQSLTVLEGSTGWKVSKKNDREQRESYFTVVPNLRVKAEFKGKILDMVLDMLKRQFSTQSVDKTMVLKQGKTPFFLTLFITSICPYCPKTVRDISKLALANSNIYLDIVDGQLYDRLAQTHNIKAAPTLVYNENFRWTGQVDVLSVIEVLDNENPEHLSARSLLAMIETGKASVVAGMMIERQSVFKSLFDLLLDDKWSVRLGAMVVAEEIGNLDAALGFKLMERLWTSFGTAVDTVRGDILYLAGSIGSVEFIDRIDNILNKLLMDDLKEAAHEAIQCLTERYLNGN